MAEGQQSVRVDTSGMGAGESLWQTCTEQLAQEMPEQQFNTWIKPLSANVSEDFSKVTIFVGNRFKLDWIRAQYSTRISTMLEKIYGQPVQLELALAPRESQLSKLNFPANMRDRPPIEEPPDLAEDKVLQGQRNRLNSALTFDTLVEGSANRMARAAAMHVSDMPGICTTRFSSMVAWAWARPT
jgi:chromosomal replication initiator protein